MFTVIELLSTFHKLKPGFEDPSRIVAKGRLKLERSKYDQMISFASQANRLERSCVQLIEVKSTVFSEPLFVICFHLQAGRLLVVNHQHCHDGCKGKVCKRKNEIIFSDRVMDVSDAGEKCHGKNKTKKLSSKGNNE